MQPEGKITPTMTPTLTLKESNLRNTRNTILVQSRDWLYEQAQTNNWYKWVKFTGEQINVQNCYMCSRNRQDALYITNTKYSWKLCDEEFRRDGKISGNDHIIACSAQCLIFIGSSRYGKIYREKNVTSDSMSKVMERCREMDISLPNKISKLSVPEGADLYIEKGLECYQNDEGKEKAEDVGMISDDLCDIIWNITNTCESLRYTRTLDAIKGGRFARSTYDIYVTSVEILCIPNTG